MLNKTFKAGQKIRVIGDTFKVDPHGLPIGTVATIDYIVPATPYGLLPPMVKFMIALEGQQPHDLPERIHVRFGDKPLDYANLVFEDVELVAGAGTKVKMLEDDFTDGYAKGDVFKAFEENGDLYFRDNDGDIRPLDSHEYEVID